eukprot:9477708-Pyramimonas_sp.AAC.2
MSRVLSGALAEPSKAQITTTTTEDRLLVMSPNEVFTFDLYNRTREFSSRKLTKKYQRSRPKK